MRIISKKDWKKQMIIVDNLFLFCYYSNSCLKKAISLIKIYKSLTLNTCYINQYINKTTLRRVSKKFLKKVLTTNYIFDKLLNVDTKKTQKICK